ncbi:MAG: hypothetical protein ED557_15065 [Balneola sp.]|nr:MAG: hypothetical protein ED557_15065 [Balneola sp.]
MKKQYIYIAFIASIVLAYIGFQIYGPKPIDWSQSYISTHKKPFGTYILFNELDHLFPGEQLGINMDPIFISLGDSYQPPVRNWVFIDRSLSIDPWETELLLDEVSEGNYVFMAALSFSGKLADTLNISTDYYYTPFDSTRFDQTIISNFSNPALKDPDGWKFNGELRNYFLKVDSSSTTSLGTNQYGEVNFIRVEHGEGAFFLHSNPLAFTNFYMKETELASYAFTALSYLPVRPTIWDEYYKRYREIELSPMRYILANTPLRNGWFISVAAILLFMIFRSKREQRIIPVLAKPKNTTIAFANTIGSLYLEQGSHKTMFQKKYLFFLEYIRSNLNLNTQIIDDTFIKAVSDRSGIFLEEIEKLFDLILLLNSKEEITEQELTIITQRIDRFYKQSLR